MGASGDMSLHCPGARTRPSIPRDDLALSGPASVQSPPVLDAHHPCAHRILHIYANPRPMISPTLWLTARATPALSPRSPSLPRPPVLASAFAPAQRSAKHDTAAAPQQCTHLFCYRIPFEDRSKAALRADRESVHSSVCARLSIPTTPNIRTVPARRHKSALVRLGL